MIIKKILIIMIFSTRIFASNEINWDLLKKLDVDAKTKKLITPKELKNKIGKEISIKGFMMPLDYDSKAVAEFLFMPYIPSCMHVPPPPPNQLILVKMAKGSKVTPTFSPAEISGKLLLKTNTDLESSFEIEGKKLTEIKDFKMTPPPSTLPGEGIIKK